MKRRLAFLVTITGLVFLLMVTGHHGPSGDESTDGLLHKCGLITEQGVTEHLSAYSGRCSSK